MRFYRYNFFFLPGEEKRLLVFDTVTNLGQLFNGEKSACLPASREQAPFRRVHFPPGDTAELFMCRLALLRGHQSRRGGFYPAAPLPYRLLKSGRASSSAPVPADAKRPRLSPQVSWPPRGSRIMPPMWHLQLPPRLLCELGVLGLSRGCREKRWRLRRRRRRLCL